MIGPYNERDLPDWVVKANEAMKKAVKAAVEEHWRAGRPVYIWRDEQVMALYADGTCVPAGEVERGGGGGAGGGGIAGPAAHAPAAAQLRNHT